MGHDDHFLQRGVERLGPAELTRALGLYRNPELIAYVLSVSELPKDAPRIAISLATTLADGTPRGPYVLVDRDGRFVTCLGRRMKVDLPVLPHDDLEDLARRHVKWRDRLAAVNSPEGDGMIRDMMGGELGLSREQAALFAALVPVMPEQMLEFFVTNYNYVLKLERDLRLLRYILTRRTVPRSLQLAESGLSAGGSACSVARRAGRRGARRVRAARPVRAARVERRTEVPWMGYTSTPQTPSWATAVSGDGPLREPGPKVRVPGRKAPCSGPGAGVGCR